MILSFKERFNEQILNGTKIHTIREDKPGRWHEGRKIHFANHIRTPQYNQFHFDYCTGVQRIIIHPDWEIKRIFIETMQLGEPMWKVFQPETIAFNDGFDTIADFWEWFDQPFTGKIIHWTDFKYKNEFEPL